MEIAGQVTIRVSHDASQATLTLPLGFDPSLVTPEHLLTVARDAGILIDEAVERAIDHFVEAFLSDPARIEAVIATATPPQPGKNGWIEWADGLDPNEPQEVPEDQDQPADYYKGRDYPAVRVGNTVGIMHPPTEGTDGRDVRARVLKARPGKDIARKLHKSFSLNADGSEYLLLTNRRCEGFWTELPSPGLVVLRVGPNDRPSAPQKQVQLLPSHGLGPAARSELQKLEQIAWPQPGKTELTVAGVRVFAIRRAADVVYFEVKRVTTPR